MVVPKSVAAALWSYDVTKMDTERDKVRIITNVLNYGTFEAVEWVRNYYAPKEITMIVANPRRGEWTPKSLNLWKHIYLEV